VESAVDSEFNIHRIRVLLAEKPSSVKALAATLGIDPKTVLNYIVALRQRGWVDIGEMVDGSPNYIAQEVT
jgi:predicted ArsR family transcriptional regulator